MNHFIKPFLVSFLIVILLSACSTTSLQSARMDEAEQQTILAEQALRQKDHNSAVVAKETAGTANAYLATVRDYIKFLTPAEKARLTSLQQRVNMVIQQANQYY